MPRKGFDLIASNKGVIISVSCNFFRQEHIEPGPGKTSLSMLLNLSGVSTIKTFEPSD